MPGADTGCADAMSDADIACRATRRRYGDVADRHAALVLQVRRVPRVRNWGRVDHDWLIEKSTVKCA
eukprot:3602265-Rhodomonas_salina.2